MEVRSLTLQAGVRTAVPSPGRFFMLIETSSPIDVEFQKNRSTNREKGRDVEAGYKSFPDPTQPGDALIQSFDGVVFTSAAAQTIRYAISDRQGDYARVAQTVFVTNPTGLLSTADVVVGAAAAVIIAANASRRSLLLVNNGGQPIRVGDSSITAARGILLVAGASLTLNTTGAVYGIREGASNSSVTVLEEVA